MGELYERQDDIKQRGGKADLFFGCINEEKGKICLACVFKGKSIKKSISKGHKKTIGDDGKVLYIYCGGSYLTMSICQNS